MKKLALCLLSLNLLAAPAFADHNCGCDEKCAKSCEKGEKENCKCDKCDCKKEGKSCHGNEKKKD